MKATVIGSECLVGVDRLNADLIEIDVRPLPSTPGRVELAEMPVTL